MRYNKGFIGIGMIIAIVTVLAVGGGAVYYATKTPTPSSNTEGSNYPPVDQNQNSTTPANTQNQNSNSSSAPVGTPTITVTSPNGGEVWNQNSQYTIRWTYSGLDKNDEVYISLRLSDSSGIDIGVCSLSKKSSAGIGYISLVPRDVKCIRSASDPAGTLSDLKSGGRYKVQIGAPKYGLGLGVADHSDNYFTITSPSVSTLKTYQNSTYGFEFKYPSAWKECDSEASRRLVDPRHNTYVKTVCLYDPTYYSVAELDGSTKGVVFYVDMSGRLGTFGALRTSLATDHQYAISSGLHSVYAEKTIGGRSYLHGGAGDVGEWGTYYTLLDSKTEQKTFLVATYINAIPELETILSSLKTKEDNLNF